MGSVSIVISSTESQLEESDRFPFLSIPSHDSVFSEWTYDLHVVISRLLESMNRNRSVPKETS